MQTLTLEAAAVGRESVFAMLTLDVVRVFYELMGFNPQAQARLQGALRDATLTVRKEIVDALVNGSPKPTMATFCRPVEASLGTGTTEHLVWWLQNVYHAEPQSQIPLQDWTHLLRHCHREGDEGWRRLPFPPHLAAEAFRRFAMSVDVKEYEGRVDQIEARPLSDWDLHMYASQTYDFDGDLEGGWPNPLDRVASTVSVYQRYGFWAWVLRVLAPQQQLKLRDKAFEIAKSDELNSIKELVPPSALDIGL